MTYISRLRDIYFIFIFLKKALILNQNHDCAKQIFDKKKTF
jgi:hypothetical protein